MTEQLKSTHDRKTRARKYQQNTFGLLPANTCPGATVGDGGCLYIPEGKKKPVCYVFNTMSCFPAVQPALAYNTDLLTQANYPEKVRLLYDEFTRFYTSEQRRDCPSLYYRLHWAGDIFDREYAYALKTAMRMRKELTYWCYTRSFGMLGSLYTVDNLVLYLSLDKINMRGGLIEYYANIEHAKCKLSIAYMSSTNDFANEFKLRRIDNWAETPPKLTPCPVDTGKLPLEGGCMACKKCLGIRGQPKKIWFAS